MTVGLIHEFVINGGCTDAGVKGDKFPSYSRTLSSLS